MSVQCPVCDGAGGREIGAYGHRGWAPDPVCGGTGHVSLERHIRITEARAERLPLERLHDAARRQGRTPWAQAAHERGEVI